LGIEMRGINVIASWVLVVMAEASLISMIAAFSLNRIVTHNLYSYGLQFSYGWAIPYWNMVGVIFALAWVNIMAAIALQVYLTRKTKEKPEEQRETEPASEKPWTGERKETEPMNEETWSAYTLSDGSTIKVKHKLKSAKRLQKFSPDGMPIYVVDYDNIVQVVSVPEKLIKKTKESPA
jgi:uncharacterized membrane protein